MISFGAWVLKVLSLIENVLQKSDRKDGYFGYRYAYTERDRPLVNALLRESEDEKQSYRYFENLRENLHYSILADSLYTNEIPRKNRRQGDWQKRERKDFQGYRATPVGKHGIGKILSPEKEDA